MAAKAKAPSYLTEISQMVGQSPSDQGCSFANARARSCMSLARSSSPTKRPCDTSRRW